MSRGETGRAFVTTRSRMMNGWFTLSSSLRAYDQLTASAMPMVTAAVVANRVRACQRRVFFTVVLDAAGNVRFRPAFTERGRRSPTRAPNPPARQEGHSRGYVARAHSSRQR